MMKQLHKQSNANHRRDEEIPMGMGQNAPYSPKAFKPTRSLPRSINYLFKEQRLLFILVGILIGSTFFILQPTLSRLGPSEPTSSIPRTISTIDRVSTRFPAIPAKLGRVPAGISRRRSRIVVTGGAGFVGSHLVDKLIKRGDDVIVIDNFFTGRKENLVHHFGNPRFELIRHDVVEPILLEVDQIYHLACPASPVHYKYNPVKTIISFIVIIRKWVIVVFFIIIIKYWMWSVLRSLTVWVWLQDQCDGYIKYVGSGKENWSEVFAYEYQWGLWRPTWASSERDLLGKCEPNWWVW